MSYSKHSNRMLVLFSVLAVAGCAAQIDDGSPAQATAESLSKCELTIPDAIAVPDGNKLAFTLKGVGAQIYACQATAAGGAAWVFQAPDADLFGPHHHLAGSHYAGPTWEALDGSTVVGMKLAAVTVDATAIPWLLLQAASHAGDGRMTKVAYIQRLDTVGGLAPADGCDVPHIGAVANVDYTATYAFYEAKKK